MEWSKVKLPDGCKLFRVHHFTYIFKGTTYLLEINEFSNGVFSGHGQKSIDESSVVDSVSASSLEECLQKMADKISGQQD